MSLYVKFQLMDKENWAPMLQYSSYYEYSLQHPFYSVPDFRHDSVTNRGNCNIYLFHTSYSTEINISLNCIGIPI